MANFTRQDIDGALRRMGMLRYWPTDPATRAEIAALLVRIVPHREALEWLVSAVIDHVGEWPGPKELRGLLCWRFRPADGVESECALAGFTPSDGEVVYLERHAKPPVIESPFARELIGAAAARIKQEHSLREMPNAEAETARPEAASSRLALHIPSNLLEAPTLP